MAALSYPEWHVVMNLEEATNRSPWDTYPAHSSDHDSLWSIMISLFVTHPKEATSTLNSHPSDSRSPNLASDMCTLLPPNVILCSATIKAAFDELASLTPEGETYLGRALREVRHIVTCTQ